MIKLQCIANKDSELTRLICALKQAGAECRIRPSLGKEPKAITGGRVLRWVEVKSI